MMMYLAWCTAIAIIIGSEMSALEIVSIWLLTMPICILLAYTKHLIKHPIRRPKNKNK